MTPKKRTRQFAALLIASALSVSVSNSAVASAEEFQDHGAKGGFASGVMAELLARQHQPSQPTGHLSAGKFATLQVAVPGSTDSGTLRRVLISP